MKKSGYVSTCRCTERSAALTPQVGYIRLANPVKHLGHGRKISTPSLPGRGGKRTILSTPGHPFPQEVMEQL